MGPADQLPTRPRGQHRRADFPEHLAQHARSIGLIRADPAHVVVTKNPWSCGTEVRLRFTYKTVPHELKVTDTTYHAHCLDKGVGDYPLSDRTLVTVSFAEPCDESYARAGVRHVAEGHREDRDNFPADRVLAEVTVPRTSFVGFRVGRLLYSRVTAKSEWRSHDERPD